jgi:uncharacterized protein YcbK (DUF882 family)
LWRFAVVASGEVMQLARRSLLGGALGLAGTAAMGGQALAALDARSLSFLNLHTGERLKATYWEGGAYVTDALKAMDRLLRDFRTGDVHPIAPGLYDLLTALTTKVGSGETIQIISGYRSPATNGKLHQASSGVATKSLHMDGKAMDIRIAGVDLSRLRDAAWSLQKGGVGYYPGAANKFVHVDVGRVRRW